MKSSKPLVITFSARPVEAFRAPFSRRGETYSDVDVALDEISSLIDNVEPAVLRVEASGGSLDERCAVWGDWLCVDHEPPVRLGMPSWPYSEESRSWSDAREWIDAWETCRDARWMLSGAQECRGSRRLVAAAAAACAVSAMPYVPRDVAGPRVALESVAKWVSGSATEEEMKAALMGAYYAATELEGKAQAAAYAAYYAYYEPSVSVAHAAAVHRRSIEDQAAYAERLAELAGVVRGRLTSEAVLRAVVADAAARRVAR